MPPEMQAAVLAILPHYMVDRCKGKYDFSFANRKIKFYSGNSNEILTGFKILSENISFACTTASC